MELDLPTYLPKNMTSYVNAPLWSFQLTGTKLNLVPPNLKLAKHDKKVVQLPKNIEK